MNTSTITERRLAITTTLRSGQRPHRESQHVVGQDLFRGVLIRERKRADRSDEPLALVLVGLKDVERLEPASTWRSVVEALSAAKRETDVLGWFEKHAAIGVILADIPATNAGFVAEFEERVRRELARRLEQPLLARLSVRLLIHPEPRAAIEGKGTVDPLLTQLRGPIATRDALKRGLDIIGSLALLSAFAPVFAIIATLVKLTSPGPVFFRQKRVGQHAQPFTMLKFRSMRVDANAAIHQQYVTAFIKGTQEQTVNGGQAVFKLTSDPRITPVGNFLRKTSLDELPQFWNVLCGSMSLVGPRPPLQYEVEQYKAWHCRRVLDAKPGITGLWQVEGRSRTTFDEMVRLDLRYARTWSLWTDLKILLATPAAVIAGKGAC